MTNGSLSASPRCEATLRAAFAEGTDEGLSAFDFEKLAKRVSEEENAKLAEAAMRQVYGKDES